MGIGRILPGVAVMNGRIYVVGGEQESQILANGEAYDPSEDSWTKVASMVCTNQVITSLFVKTIFWEKKFVSTYDILS